MYIMCVCLFSALSRRVGALQISILIIISMTATVLEEHEAFNRLADESMIAEHVAGESMIPNHDNGCCLQPSPMNR